MRARITPLVLLLGLFAAVYTIPSDTPHKLMSGRELLPNNPSLAPLKISIATVENEFGKLCHGHLDTDEEWIQRLAEQGNPEAQYRLGHSDRTWLQRAAAQGYPSAISELCKDFLPVGDHRHDDPADVKICTTNADVTVDEMRLYRAYATGEGTTRDVQKAYLWALVGNIDYFRVEALKKLNIPDPRAIAAELSEADRSSLRAKAQEVKAKRRQFAEDIQMDMQWPRMIYNAVALTCGESSFGWRLTDTCGDWAAISNWGGEYAFINIHTGEKRRSPVSAPLYPKDWHCGPAKNMPMPKIDEEKYDGVSAGSGHGFISCGNILLKRRTREFFDKESGRSLGICRENQKCAPEEWKCGLPTALVECFDCDLL